MVTKNEIIEGLRELGLAAGDVVVVHSSLSSFGEVEGGADAVVDALLEVLGDDGTLIVPTFNYAPEVFDPQQTRSQVGAITEAVRIRSDAIRSLHPTHSVAAIGPLAEAITEGHWKTHSFARGSALFKALQAHARILQLGVTHTSNSTIHVAEEIAQVPYLERQRQVKIRTRDGRVITKWIRRPGCSHGFNKIEETLRQEGAITEIRIGQCVVRLMTARAVVDAAVEALKLSPDALLCDRPDCESCAEARAMIAAMESEQQDKDYIESAVEEEQAIERVMRMLGVSEVVGMEADDRPSAN